jgi:transcriptional regulator with XRE-family HTH domain
LQVQKVPEKNEKFGRALRLLRGEQSQAEFVRRIGFLSQSAYAKYEMGRVPRFSTLEKLARSLGVASEDLLEGRLPHPVAPMSTGLLFDRWLKALSLRQLREISDWLHENQRTIGSPIVQAFLSTAIEITHQRISQLLIQAEADKTAPSAGSTRVEDDKL